MQEAAAMRPPVLHTYFSSLFHGSSNNTHSFGLSIVEKQ